MQQMQKQAESKPSPLHLPPAEPPKPKYAETNIEFTEKVLNVYVETKEDCTEVYVVVRDSIRCFVLEEPLAKKIIKFDPIYEENANMPCPIDKYKD